MFSIGILLIILNANVSAKFVNRRNNRNHHLHDFQYGDVESHSFTASNGNLNSDVSNSAAIHAVSQILNEMAFNSGTISIVTPNVPVTSIIPDATNNINAKSVGSFHNTSVIDSAMFRRVGSNVAAGVTCKVGEDPDPNDPAKCVKKVVVPYPIVPINGNIADKTVAGFVPDLTTTKAMPSPPQVDKSAAAAEKGPSSEAGRGLSYIAVGYNIFKANPQGDDDNNSDTGYTQPLIEFSYFSTIDSKEKHYDNERRYIVPEEAYFYQMNSCTRNSKATILCTDEQYQQQMAEHYSVGGGLSSDIASLAGKGSKGFIEFSELTSKEDVSVQTTKSTCIFYHAGLTMSDAIYHIPKDGFKQAMKNLSSISCIATQVQIEAILRELADENEASNFGCTEDFLKAKAEKEAADSAKAECYKLWYPFFEEYGTHCITEANLGGMMITTATLQKRSKVTDNEKSNLRGSTVNAQFNQGANAIGVNYAGDKSIHFDQGNSNADQLNTFKVQFIGGLPPGVSPSDNGSLDPSFKEWSNTVQQYPMPVKIQIDRFDIVFLDRDTGEPFIDKNAYLMMLPYYLNNNGKPPVDLEQGDRAGTQELTMGKHVDDSDIEKSNSISTETDEISDRINLQQITFFTPMEGLLRTKSLDGANIIFGFTAVGNIQIRYQLDAFPYLEQIIFSSKSAKPGSEMKDSTLLRTDCTEEEIGLLDETCNPWYIKFHENDLCLKYMGLKFAIWCTQTQFLHHDSLFHKTGNSIQAVSAIADKHILKKSGSFFSSDNWSCPQAQWIVLSPEGDLIMFGTSVNSAIARWLWKSESSYSELKTSTVTPINSQSVSTFSSGALPLNLLPTSTTVALKPTPTFKNYGVHNCGSYKDNKNYFHSENFAKPFVLKPACNPQAGYLGYEGACSCAFKYFGSAKLDGSNVLGGCTQVQCDGSATPGYVKGDGVDLCKCAPNFLGSVRYLMNSKTATEALSGCWTVSTGYVAVSSGDTKIPACEKGYFGFAVFSSDGTMTLTGCNPCPVDTPKSDAGNGNKCSA